MNSEPEAAPAIVDGPPVKRRRRPWGFGWAATTIELLLPPRCSFCSADLAEIPSSSTGTPLAAKAGLVCRLCPACLRGLFPPPLPSCPKCGIPRTAAECRECAVGNFNFTQLAHAGLYQGDLRAAVLKTKHSQHEHLARALTEQLWLRSAPGLQAFQPDVVAPIPMHWRRRFLRGANASETIAACLGRQLGVPCYPLLRQIRPSAPQHHLSRRARKENMRGVFALRRGYRCQGARVLLVDDVVTTGATVDEASRVLLKQGAIEVAVAALARAQGH